MITTPEQRAELCKKNWIIAFELERERQLMLDNPGIWSDEELNFMSQLVETFKQRATFNQITIEKGENNYAIAE